MIFFKFLDRYSKMTDLIPEQNISSLQRTLYETARSKYEVNRCEYNHVIDCIAEFILKKAESTIVYKTESHQPSGKTSFADSFVDFGCLPPELGYTEDMNDDIVKRVSCDQIEACWEHPIPYSSDKPYIVLYFCL